MRAFFCFTSVAIYANCEAVVFSPSHAIAQVSTAAEDESVGNLLSSLFEPNGPNSTKVETTADSEEPLNSVVKEEQSKPTAGIQQNLPSQLENLLPAPLNNIIPSFLDAIPQLLNGTVPLDLQVPFHYAEQLLEAKSAMSELMSDFRTQRQHLIENLDDAIRRFTESIQDAGFRPPMIQGVAEWNPASHFPILLLDIPNLGPFNPYHWSPEELKALAFNVTPDPVLDGLAQARDNFQQVRMISSEMLKTWQNLPIARAIRANASQQL